jgi:hypothetical protein
MSQHSIRVLIAFFLMPFTSLLAQEKLPPIQLDRPDQTECPFIVPAGWIQMENGFGMEEETKGVRNWTLPTSLIKLGLNKRWELRVVATSLLQQRASTNATGVEPLTVGFKVNLMEEKGILPLTSFIGHLTPGFTGAKKYQTNYTAPSFRFLMQHTLSDRWVLAYNLGAEWDGVNPEARYLYTLTGGYSISDRWGSYVEIYGFAPERSQADHRMDGGFTYLVNDNIILDWSGGIGLTPQSPDYYVAFGLSFRFKALR